MGHCEQCYVQLFCLCVQLSLEVHAHRTCALVQHSEYRPVVEQSSHCDTLLLSA